MGRLVRIVAPDRPVVFDQAVLPPKIRNARNQVGEAERLAIDRWIATHGVRVCPPAWVPPHLAPLPEGRNGEPDLTALGAAFIEAGLTVGET